MGKMGKDPALAFINDGAEWIGPIGCILIWEAGRSRCSQEGVGGPQGYREFLKTIRNWKRPAHEAYSE